MSVAARARIGVHGGSFDPPHFGHLAVAEAALEAAHLDQVIFVPTHRNPLKGHDPLATDADRRQMLELAIAGDPRFLVSSLEIERTGPTYTVDTLEAFSPLGELFFIMGSDVLGELARWKDPTRVTELATLMVAERAGSPVGESPFRAVAFDSPRIAISSRDLRERMARGLSIRYLVPAPVWEYISERGLYRPA